VRFESGAIVTAEWVKKAIREHVDAESKKGAGVFALEDPVLTKSWKLTLEKIHDPVRTFEKNGQNFYFACSDFRSLDGGEILDVDFWLILQLNRLQVAETRIHKVDGRERYTYDGVRTTEIR
jgi:hypothetical protein